MKIIVSFLVSFFVWFFVFSIPVSQEPGMMNHLRGVVCGANATLFIKMHRLIGDPFDLVGALDE